MHKYLKKYFNKEYMDWQEYERRINFIDQYYWQQTIRQKNF